MADRADFYDVLGVGRGASSEEIQRAYRKLARTYHPDVNKDPTAEARFAEVAEAYDVLSDPDTRKRYDAFGHDFRQVPEGVDAAQWAQRGRAPAGGQRVQWSSTDFDDIDLSDLFGEMFGGGRRRPRAPVRGANQEVEVELPLEDAYRGATRTITLTGPDGPRRLDVNIPAGVVDGQRIRLRGQGSRGPGGGPPGDLYLIVDLAPSKRYRVEGRDVYVELPIAPWEGALGTSAPVHYPGGTATVKVPAGTSSGRRLRLKGRGIPDPKGTPGDLYAEVRMVVPRKLSDDEQRLFEELARVSSFDPRRSR
ncbi:MAG: heat shock protein DnaJ domain protein [Acidimicrobiales bacterium]|nr:heat shock protein DnaJ domain protein [Acidimicrobiales bacterium]